MEIESSVGLLSGANRGLGNAPTAELLSRGATVYAGAGLDRSVFPRGVADWSPQYHYASP